MPVIFGLEPTESLPEKWIPLEAVAVVKCLGDDGREALALTATGHLSAWEAAGMLQAALDQHRNALGDMFTGDEEGEA